MGIRNVVIEMYGLKFGYLTVIDRAPNEMRGGGPAAMWYCECICGSIITVHGRLLRKGVVKSCGCMWKKMISAKNSRHGKSNTQAYRHWMYMTRRCTDPNHDGYAHYRTVEIAEEFKTFEGFYAELGDPPTGYTLDRSDNSKGYIQGNVRWATWKEQGRNKTNNRLFTVNGTTQLLCDWARQLGVDHSVIIGRLKLGWPLDKALTVPKGGPHMRRNLGF